MYRLGWFSTGRGQGSRGLLKETQDKIRSGQIEAELEFVFCSRGPGESEATDIFLKMVEDYHIPLVTFSYRQYKAKAKQPDTGPGGALSPWRLDYDREVMRRLEGFHPDLCVLAGYMLIVGEEMCRHYDMINLHPAAPGGPAGTWREVIWQLIDGRADETGVMIHLVTPELDTGPPVTYCTFPIRGKPFDRYWEEIGDLPAGQVKLREGEGSKLFRSIREHGYARELPLIIATIGAFSRGKVKITPQKTVTGADGKLIEGYDLSREIDEAVKNTLSG